MIKKLSKKIKSYKKSIRKKRYAITLWSVLVVTALAITGIYYFGSRNGKEVPSSVFSSSILSSSNVSQQESSITESSEVLSSVPTPMPSLEETDPSTLSVDKLGWASTPGGGKGIPAKTKDSRIEMCDRFDAIWQGDIEDSKIYITMDIGYEYNNNTSKILDIAKEKDFKITFFVVGKLFTYENYRDLLLRIYEEGHLIASHSWNHDHYDDLFRTKGRSAVEEDLRAVENAYKELTGGEMKKFFRFPSGEYSEAVMYIVRQCGYRSVFWSFAYRDWLVDEQPDPQESLEKVINNLYPGAVLLLHTVSDTNVKILPEVIDEIRSSGYETALIDEFSDFEN